LAFDTTKVTSASQRFDESEVPILSFTRDPTKTTSLSQGFRESQTVQVSLVIGASPRRKVSLILTSHAFDDSKRLFASISFNSEAIHCVSELQVVTVSFAHSQSDSFVLLIHKSLDFVKSSVIPVTIILQNSFPVLSSTDFYETTTMISNEMRFESELKLKLKSESESNPQGGGVEVQGILPILISTIGAALLLLILAAILMIYLTRRKRLELNDNEIVYATETEFAEEMTGHEFNEDFADTFFNAANQDGQNGGFFMEDDLNFLPSESDETVFRLNSHSKIS
jgi:uncharacterized membrane protein